MGWVVVQLVGGQREQSQQAILTAGKDGSLDLLMASKAGVDGGSVLVLALLVETRFFS